jgi:2-phosphoglycerate kinase
VIVLIGGPPRCGKTILARRLGRQLGCSVLPTDYLGSVISRYIPAEQREARLPSVGAGTLNDERFMRFSAAEMLAGYRRRARTAWTGIQALIEYAIFDGQRYIIEGFHIEPEFARHLTTVYGDEHFRIGFLVKTDSEAITTGLQAARETRDWARDRTTDPATFRLIAAWVQHYSAYIQTEAARYGFPLFHTDREFAGDLATALDYFAGGRVTGLDL